MPSKVHSSILFYVYSGNCKEIDVSGFLKRKIQCLGLEEKCWALWFEMFGSTSGYFVGWRQKLSTPSWLIEAIVFPTPAVSLQSSRGADTQRVLHKYLLNYLLQIHQNVSTSKIFANYLGISLVYCSDIVTFMENRISSRSL